MLHTTTITMASMAIHQLVTQLLMAEFARHRPMQMMTGPVTMGGKNRMTRAAPKDLNSAESMAYMMPAQATPTPA